MPCTLHVVPCRHSPDMGAYLSTGYLAQHGYAELYVDVRGTAGSEVVSEDEYSVKEHEDTVRVVDWPSKQH